MISMSAYVCFRVNFTQIRSKLRSRKIKSKRIKILVYSMYVSYLEEGGTACITSAVGANISIYTLIDENVGELTSYI